jgi:hypothetical protein
VQRAALAREHPARLRARLRPRANALRGLAGEQRQHAGTDGRGVATPRAGDGRRRRSGLAGGEEAIAGEAEELGGVRWHGLSVEGVKQDVLREMALLSIRSARQRRFARRSGATRPSKRRVRWRASGLSFQPRRRASVASTCLSSARKPRRPASSMPSAAASSGSSNGSQCIHTQPSFGSQLCCAARGASESAAPAGEASAPASTTSASRARRRRVLTGRHRPTPRPT